MSQLKQKQISGLVTALGLKVETASNPGASGTGVFIQKTGTDLEFIKLAAGTALTGTLASNVLTFDFGVNTIATTITSAATGDLIPLADASDSSNTKKITKANFLSDYAPLASPTFTGTVTVPEPSNGTDAATKNYVDSSINGLDWKESVRAATTANGTLGTAYANTSVIDGVTLATGDRILLKDQTTGSENGIYTVNASGAPTRATDADTDAEVTAGMATFVEEGTGNADTGWVLTNDGTVTVGTTALVFAQFTGGSSFTAGAGLTLTGNDFSVNVDDIGIEIPADTLQLKDAGVTLAKMANMATASFIARNTASTGVPEVVPAATAKAMLTSREVVDKATLTAASMTLATLSQTPGSATKVQCYINGILLKETTDYTISGTTVTAANALNIAYGGSAADGNGFANDDEFQAVYTY